MAKYFMSWEVDASRAPVDPKERGALWSGMVEIVRQQIRDGITTDWGCFAGETRGYSIGSSDRTALDMSKTLQQFYPFITFEVHEVMSIDDIGELAKSMTE